eukprot:15347341-Ditylum_brightwellii.AAC.1
MLENAGTETVQQDGNPSENIQERASNRPHTRCLWYRRTNHQHKSSKACPHYKGRKPGGEDSQIRLKRQIQQRMMKLM